MLYTEFKGISPVMAAASSSEIDPLGPVVGAVTLAEQVADRIVEAIAAQRLVSGQRLIETELADGLNVSRVPVREAMRILASQGIIVPVPRRGMRVATFDAAWATQLHNARVAIERLCARIVAEKLAAERLAADRPLVGLLADCVAAIDVASRRANERRLAVNRADLAFHNAMFAIADSPLLTTLWTAISRHVLIMFSIETYRDTDFARVTEEHSVYLEVLISGSRQELDEEIDRHVAGLRTFASDTAPSLQPEGRGE